MAGVAARFEDERRELLDRLDALQKALEEERAEHVDAQAARDAAAGRIATLERELGDLREARQNHIEASARVAELEAGKQALADEIAAIKAELDGQKIKLDEERAAHAEAIAGREAAESHLAEAQCRLSVLDNTQEQMATAEQRLTETLARLEASEASVAQQKAAVCQLGAEVEELRGALADTEKKFEDTVRHAEDTARELADLRHSAAAEDIARQQRSDAEARLAETTSAMEDLRQRVVALETELDAERKSLADLQAEREREQMFGDELQRELTALREQSAERQFAEEAALAESSDLQREEPAQPVVTDTPLHGEAKEEAAPAPIVAGGNAVDEAASRTTKTAEEPPADEPIVAPALAHGGATRPARIAQKTAPATKARDPQPATPVDSLIKSRIGRALEKKEHVKDKRRAKRHSARKVASLWNEGMSATLSCTMLDRSSSGAKLEVLEDRYNDRINEIAIGDRFMLSLSYAQERTTMACEVMWVAGRRCGVRFCGQIHTEVNKPVRRVMPEPELLKKPSATTAIKSLFGAS
ncbi:MAG: PilZ domain-containing protein, partial [Alphaproteobacteria bacterium]|nr:PilZ domain-containing protein [Alphaproteobacteria bacterium]